MKRLIPLAVGIVLGVVAASAAGRMTTPDPLAVSPQYDTVRFENDRVRVLKYRLQPGEKEAMHTHPAGLVYTLSGATIRSTREDGKASEVTGKAGDVLWREITTHTAENIGAIDARARAIDVKPCRP